MERTTDEPGPSADNLRSKRQPWVAPAAQGWVDAGTAAERAGERAGEQRAAWLARTIEAEIIPRLMLAHRTPHAVVLGRTAARAGDPAPNAHDVLDFSALLLAAEAGAAPEFVRSLRSLGVPIEAIYLELLAPAARRLGALWEADLCDFTEVTVGLWRVQQVIHDLSASFHDGAVSEGARGRRVLLAPAPGSQHTLGLLMVSEFFRRAGWDVAGDPCAGPDEVVTLVHDEWFDVAGFSLGSECHVDALARAILALRRASMNRAIGVMVGGPVILARPELVAVLGADASATDAPGAILEAERLVAGRVRPC